MAYEMMYVTEKVNQKLSDVSDIRGKSQIKSWCQIASEVLAIECAGKTTLQTTLARNPDRDLTVSLGSILVK